MVLSSSWTLRKPIIGLVGLSYSSFFVKWVLVMVRLDGSRGALQLLLFMFWLMVLLVLNFLGNVR